MVDITPYGQRTQTPVGTVAGDQQPMTQVAQAVEGLGNTGAAVGGEFADLHNQTAARQADTARVQNANVILYGDGTADNPGFLSLRGQDAVNAMPKVIEALQKTRTDAGANLNPVQARLYNAQQDVRDTLWQQSLGSFRQQQHMSWMEDTAKAAIATGTANFGKYAGQDANQAELARQTVEGETHKLLQLQGLDGDPNIVGATLAKANSDLFASAVRSQADPDKAKSILATYGDRILGPERAALQSEVGEKSDLVDAQKWVIGHVQAGGSDTVHPTISGNPVATKLDQDLAANGAGPYTRALGTTIANIESSFKTGAKNGSSAGLFQYHPDTYSSLGGSDINDPSDQAKTFVKEVNAYTPILKKALGRDPSASEFYLAHQQGIAGAVAILTAPANETAIQALERVGVSPTTAVRSIAGNIGQAYKTPEQQAAANATASSLMASDFTSQWAQNFSKKAITAATNSAANPTFQPATAPSYESLIASARVAAGWDESNPVASAMRQQKFEEAARSAYRANGQMRMDQDRQADELVAPYMDPLQHPEITSPGQIPGFDKLSPERRTEYDRQLYERNQHALVLEQAQTRVGQALSGNLPIDPKDELQKKVLDADFATRGQSWGPIGTPAFNGQAAAYSAKVGAVPLSLQGWARSALRSNDPKTVVNAAGLMQTLKQANPHLLDDFDENDRGIANLISERSSWGVPPEQAVQDAKAVAMVTPEQRKTADANYAQLEKAAPDAAFLAPKLAHDFSGGGWFSQPSAASAQMTGEFDALAKENYARLGDINAARQTAYDTVTRVWGRTGLNGSPQMMKWAPERTFGVFGGGDQDTKWQQEQLLADVGKLNLAVDGKINDRLMVQVSPMRPFDSAGRPIYSVFLRQHDGSVSPLIDNGKPYQWQPDWTSSPEHQREAAKTSAGFSAAHTQWLLKNAPGN